METKESEAKTQRVTLKAINEGMPLKGLESISQSAIYSAIRKLKKKGFIAKKGHKTFYITEAGYKSTLWGTVGESFFPTQKQNWIRLHELTYTIKILEKPNNWDNEPNSVFFRNANVNFGLTKYINQQIDNVSVQIHRDVVVIMIPPILKSKEDLAEKEALAILERTIRKIEHIYKILLWKENYINIKVSKNSYAHIHNELATKCIDEKIPLKIYHKDGQVRLLIDFSNKVPELEATHPKLAPSDSRNLSEYWEQWVDNPFMPSDIKELQDLSKATAFNLNVLTEQIKALINSQQITTEQLKAVVTLINPQAQTEGLRQEQEVQQNDKPEYIG